MYIIYAVVKLESAAISDQSRIISTYQEQLDVCANKVLRI